MSDSKTLPVGKAAALHCYTDPRFKTLKLSVNLLLPLQKEKAALYGILPGLVTRAAKEYPSFTALNRRLSELYGASLNAGVRKLGSFQCLTASVSGISSRYAFGGDDMFSELSQLLFSMLFDPLKEENGLFPEENFRQEQRQLLELKDAEYNDKIAYSHRRCEELLFQGEPAGTDRFGSREEVACLDQAALPHAWEEALGSSAFEIFVLGDCHPEPQAFQEKFAGLGTPQALEPLPFISPSAPRRLTEEQPVSQSKLSLGFRADSQPEEWLLFQLTSAVLGGVPSSKLFQNVREKMGLCYYCSSSFSPVSRALYVDSGVDPENTEKAENAILRQLEDLQAGNVTEEELLAAKLALCNSFRSVGDSLNAVENWYLARTFCGHGESPERAAEQVMSYTARQVTEAAGRLNLGAAFCLEGKNGG